MRPRANGRAPSKFPTDGVGVPLRITRMFPMKLKDVTIEKLEQQKRIDDKACIPEMMTLFDCLEKSEFNRQVCQSHVESLQSCYSNFLEKRRVEKEKRKNKSS